MTSVNGVGSKAAYQTPTTKEVSTEELEKLQAEADIAKQIENAINKDKADNFEKSEPEKEEKKKIDMKKVAWAAIVSVAAGAVAMKFMPIARRFSAKVIGSAVEKGVKLAGKLGEKHPKLAFNTEKVLNKVGSVKKELIEGNSTKLYTSVKNSLQEILGIEIKTASPVLAGIKNDVGFIDAAAATAIGYATTGKAAMQEDKEITKEDIAKEAGKIILIAG